MLDVRIGLARDAVDRFPDSAFRIVNGRNYRDFHDTTLSCSEIVRSCLPETAANGNSGIIVQSKGR
jgi:hypothetical protein